MLPATLKDCGETCCQKHCKVAGKHVSLHFYWYTERVSFSKYLDFGKIFKAELLTADINNEDVENIEENCFSDFKMMNVLESINKSDSWKSEFLLHLKNAFPLKVTRIRVACRYLLRGKTSSATLRQAFLVQLHSASMILIAIEITFEFL